MQEGIGRATAVAFATDGCTKIAICDRSADGLAQTKSIIDDKTKTMKKVEVEIVPGDVSSEESVASMMETVVKKWARIDYAVNAAGMPTSWKSSKSVQLFGSE